MVLLSGSLLISYALSIVVGYFFSKGTFDKLKPSSAFLQKLENEGGLLHGVSRCYGYVLSGVSLGHDSWIPVNASLFTVRDAHQQQQQPQQGSSLSSSQGRSIGTIGSVNSAPPSGGNQPTGFNMFNGRGRGSAPGGYEAVPTLDDNSNHEVSVVLCCLCVGLFSLCFSVFSFLDRHIHYRLQRSHLLRCQAVSLLSYPPPQLHLRHLHQQGKSSHRDD
jgi:hypothetical protein